MGKELDRIGAPFRQPEWSAAALLDEPDGVLRAHRNFVEAGADIIIANTYAVVPFHIGEDRFAARGRELAELAGRLARQAADEADRPVRVAASLPPVFGSYAPDRFDPERAPALLDVLVEAQQPAADLWLVETIASCAEADAAAAAMDRAGVAGERWFSFSLADSGPMAVADGPPRLWSGESVSAAVGTAISAGADAILLNCSAPEVISAAMPELVAAVDGAGRDLPFGAYANGFPPRPDDYTANEIILGRRDDLTPTTYGEFAEQWIGLGATIVGGCCGIHPEHIAELSRIAGSTPAPTPGG